MTNSVALVLSGGVAFGAYQARAYTRLQEESAFKAIFYAGSSVGAVTAAIILGSAPQGRVENLRRFWAASVPQLPIWPWPHARHWATAIQSRLFGVHGQFRPRISLGWSSFSRLYDLSPMRERLRKLIDFERLNSSQETLCVAATDLESGKTILFDSWREPIRIDHLLASCGFIPEFEPVRIDSRILGDGGLSANAPVEAVLFEPVRTIFVLDLFARDGRYSPDLETALARKNNLIYGNQTLRTLEILMRERSRADDENPQSIYYLSYRPRQGEAGSERSYVFQATASKSVGEQVRTTCQKPLPAQPKPSTVAGCIWSGKCVSPAVNGTAEFY
jgi:NTE family protein